MNRLSSLIDKIAKQKVAVVGDLMLDRYIWGQATRISPEAPVPIIEIERCNAVPGGAANVVRNVVGLNARACAFGCIGNDTEGKEMLELLQATNADCSSVFIDEKRESTVKTRILAANQQVIRLDSESREHISKKLQKQILQKLQEGIEQKQFSGIILEDYAKGIFNRSFMQEICDLACSSDIFISLDPHPSQLFHVNGLKLMTPNRSEAFALAGLPYKAGINSPTQDTALLNAAKKIQNKWQAELLLITLGAEGMALFQAGCEIPLHIPTRAKQVFDVSGAGDTVMATMTLALLAGASPEEAALLANAAAGIVVGYVGTTAIDSEKLRKEILLESRE